MGGGMRQYAQPDETLDTRTSQCVQRIPGVEGAHDHIYMPGTVPNSKFWYRTSPSIMWEYEQNRSWCSAASC